MFDKDATIPCSFSLEQKALSFQNFSKQVLAAAFFFSLHCRHVWAVPIFNKGTKDDGKLNRNERSPTRSWYKLPLPEKYGSCETLCNLLISVFVSCSKIGKRALENII